MGEKKLLRKRAGGAASLRAGLLLALLAGGALPVGPARAAEARTTHFRLEEATIADVHRAMMAKQLTATELVNRYLKRIEAYNGKCVAGASDPATGLQLGDITPIANAGQVNALMTLNIRGQRSATDTADNNPDLPDALETARKLDQEFARTGKLVGPLHGIPFAIKDQFDTRDMRTTDGAMAEFANDRPEKDAEVVARLRKAGAIILAKANMGEYASGDRSTRGGTSCNPYDTTRSAGRSSGGSGAAVSANLVMCAIGEETAPSARNPAANNALVGIVATHSLVSRQGLIPASLTRDRPGTLCRTTEDAATVLGVLAGYDPADPATAASVGQMPRATYRSFANGQSLKGMRIGVVREFMQPFSKADEESIRIVNRAIADLEKLGAVIVDPGPSGQLFKDAVNQIIPALDAPMLSSTYKDLFPSNTSKLPTLVRLSSDPSSVPADALFRLLVEVEPAAPGEVAFAMNRYLQQRGDRNIRNVNDLLEKAAFYQQPSIAGVSAAAQERLEDTVVETRRLTRTSDGTTVVQKTPTTTLDISGWHTRRTVLQMLVAKVMADHKLDALVYPTKTIPAPILGAPVEPSTIKSVSEKVEVLVDGVAHTRTVQRVLDTRASTAWRLSPNSGLPAIVVPAGFTTEVYDRAPVVAADHSVKAGELVGPKPVALPVVIEFLGRPFAEPVLLRIASAYEKATRHRKAPSAFPPLDSRK
jgi:Asp-tRNA(Asn)/Glu-tRNA(Gln) amidotransferase A subunit family amidase